MRVNSKMSDQNNSYHCDHKDLAILVLQHGGGCFPDVLAPELYCKTCHISATLSVLCNADSRFGKVKTDEVFGISLTPELEEKIIKWANDYQGKKWIPVEKIDRNPENTYNNASKYEGDLSGIKIIDKEKLESFSSRKPKKQ